MVPSDERGSAMSGNDDGFVTAAAAFVDAARELKALHEHAQELATVGESLRSAEATATAMVEKATDALGEARKQLTQGAAETSALTEQVSNLISALAANLERISSLIENKFEGVDFETNIDGLPVLHDCLATLECRTTASYDGGDHSIFVGEVENATVSDGDPILYFRGDYRAISA